MQREDAETLALEALGWLAGQEDLMPTFLGASGASLLDVRRRADDPEFLGAVLDFLTMDDAWISAFCDSTGRAPDAPLRARAALPGGELPHWT
ncbi:MAG: DUF3572 domain-containing protein [Pseudomonadota bacterium]